MKKSIDLHIIGLSVTALSVLFYFLSGNENFSEFISIRGAQISFPNKEAFIAFASLGVVMIIAHYAWLGRKVKLYEKAWSHTLYKHYSKHYLNVICGRSAIYEVWVELTPKEVKRTYKEGSKFIDELAIKISSSQKLQKQRKELKPF